MSEPGRVLIADESAVSRQVAATMVEHLGCRPTVVVDGVAAIREAMSGAHELVLMSLALPGVDGIEATTQIRSLETRHRTVILAVASADDPRVVDAGFDGLLQRPLTLRSMDEAMRRWTTALPALRPALDQKVVASVTRIGVDAGEDLWERLVAIFLADAGTWLPAMRTATATVDAHALFQSAHKLSGASANLGASHLAALCSTLAQDRVVEDRTGTSDVVDAVEAELERVVAALRSSVA